MAWTYLLEHRLDLEGQPGCFRARLLLPLVQFRAQRVRKPAALVVSVYMLSIRDLHILWDIGLSTQSTIQTGVDRLQSIK